MIYENQKSMTCYSLREFAKEIDLDTSVFEDCCAQRKLFRKVISDFEGGVKSGVDSTPTFFINGARYDSFDDFENLYSALAFFLNYGPTIVASTPYLIADSSISMFISFKVLNLMQYPVTLALPSFFPYVWFKYVLSFIPMM
jgi:hypothetical protein